MAARSAGYEREASARETAHNVREALQMPINRCFLPLVPPARNKAAYGGRGSGKSHFFAGLAIARSLDEPVDIVCIREVQRTLKASVKKLLEAKIVEYGVGDHFEVLDAKIKSKLGGEVIFEGMQNQTAESIKSLEGFKVAWTEEAQTLSAVSKKLLIPTIRAEGSELWWSWNPRRPDDPVDEYFRAEGAEPPPGTVLVKALYHDNAFITRELLAEAEYLKRRDFESYLHVWEGEYESRSEARVFHNWTVDEFDTPVGTAFLFGADWGFSVDPSVLVRAWLDGRRLMVDYEAYMVGCEIDQLPDLFDTVPESHRWFIRADSSRPETISYMQRHGYPKLTHAVKGPNSVEEGIEFLKTFDIVVHPRCRHVIDELKRYSYKVDPDTDEVLPILKDKDDHVIDALRYACEQKRRSTAGKVTITADDLRPSSRFM